MDQLIEEHQIQNNEVMVEDNGSAIHGGIDSSTVSSLQQGQGANRELIIENQRVVQTSLMIDTAKANQTQLQDSEDQDASLDHPALKFAIRSNSNNHSESQKVIEQTGEGHKHLAALSSFYEPSKLLLQSSDVQLHHNPTEAPAKAPQITKVYYRRRFKIRDGNKNNKGASQVFTGNIFEHNQNAYYWKSD